MNILIVSFYYPPDLSAGSFRTKALVDALLPHLAPDDRIDVLTTSPNRYANMERDADAAEDPRVHVTRIAIPQHQSGIADQAKSFLAFARGAQAASDRMRPDLVYATSSRLMTAALGARIARRRGAPLYLDLRDIFTETMGDVFKNSPLRALLPVFDWIERRTLRSASRINIVSPAFADYFAPVAGHADFATFTNGVDDLFQPLAPRPREGRRSLVMAAGNMGEGQGLHHVVPGLAALCPDVNFELIGGGGRRPELEAAIAEAGLANVRLRDPIKRARLPEEYARADLLFMHLNDLPAFERVLPSKMFEYAATGKPILAGVGGFARTFVDRHIEGAEGFAPCDVEGGAAALRTLLAGPSSFDRSDFIARYDRRIIMDEMARDLLARL